MSYLVMHYNHMRILCDHHATSPGWPRPAQGAGVIAANIGAQGGHGCHDRVAARLSRAIEGRAALAARKRRGESHCERSKRKRSRRLDIRETACLNSGNNLAAKGGRA